MTAQSRTPGDTGFEGRGNKGLKLFGEMGTRAAVAGMAAGKGVQQHLEDLGYRVLSEPEQHAAPVPAAVGPMAVQGRLDALRDTTGTLAQQAMTFNTTGRPRGGDGASTADAAAQLDQQGYMNYLTDSNDVVYDGQAARIAEALQAADAARQQLPTQEQEPANG